MKPPGRGRPRLVQRDLLAERVPDAHLDGAPVLALDHAAVDGPPDVGDGEEVGDPRQTREHVDLDLGELHRVGARVGDCGIVVVVVEARRRIWRDLAIKL